MHQFITYLTLGYDHISDLKGFDHILFILTLCAAYGTRDWRRIAILVTAFTIGHSITLALSALSLILPNPYWVELLIPITIFITSIWNVYAGPMSKEKGIGYHYAMALVFGLVHGLGFSNFFNALMGDSRSILLPLFGFNLGLEIGQFLIVLLFFSVQFVLYHLIKFEQKSWTLFFSGAGAGVSFILILERI